MTPRPIAEIRIDAQGGVQAILHVVSAQLQAARARGDSRLLVDLRGLDVPAPSLAQRDSAISEWARAAHGDLVLAVVAPPHLIDPQRYGLMLAAAFGLRAEVFEDAAPAREWLERQAEP